MLIKNSTLFKIKNYHYNKQTLTSGCKVELTNFTGKIIEVKSFSWKGSDFFLSELTEDQVLGAMYSKVKEIEENTVWYYNPEEYINTMPKICKYVKDGVKTKNFHDINYITELTISLYPKRTLVHGELQKVIWYTDEECTDTLIEVNIEYERDALGFAVRRTTTRTWYNIDNSKNTDNKITKKNYVINLLDQIEEGIRRRGNIVKGLKLPVLAFMIGTMTGTSPEIIQIGRDFLQGHQLAFQCFIDDSQKQIITNITNDETEWLDNYINQDTTIRQFIIAELSI